MSASRAIVVLLSCAFYTVLPVASRQVVVEPHTPAAAAAAASAVLDASVSEIEDDVHLVHHWKRRLQQHPDDRGILPAQEVKLTAGVTPR